MPVFEIKAHGQTFQIKAPDQDTAIAAFKKSAGLEDQPAPTERDKGIFGLPLMTQGVDAGYGMGAVTQEEQDSGEFSKPGILPISYNKQGQYKWAMPGIVEAITDPVARLGDALQGNEPVDPEHKQLYGDAANLAMGFSPGLSMSAKGMLPAAVRDMVTSNGKNLPKAVITSLQQSGIKPTQVNAALAELGPEAVLGDLSPSLQGRMASVANIPGRGSEKIMQALMERNKGANRRIIGSLDETLGAEPVPYRVEQAIKGNKKIAGEGYDPVFRDKSLSDNFSMDAAPIIDTIESALPKVVGNTRTQLEAVQKMLIDPSTGKPYSDPEMIFQVRHELDTMIDAAVPGSNTQRVLGDLRKAMDQDLGAAVPGLKSVDAQFAEQAKQQEGFDYGKTALRGGQEPVHPVEFADKVQEGAQPKGEFIGPSGVPMRIQQGMHAEIRKIVGTTANDRIAMKQILKGEGSWNRDKLETAFGKEKADALVRLFDQEAKLAESENLVFGGSKTARLAAGMEGLTKDASKKSVIRALLNTDFADALIAAGDKLTLGAMGGLREGRLNKIAEALLTRGNLRQMGAPLKVIPGIINNPAIEAALIKMLEDRQKKVSRPVNYDGLYDPNAT